MLYNSDASGSRTDQVAASVQTDITKTLNDECLTAPARSSTWTNTQILQISTSKLTVLNGKRVS